MIHALQNIYIKKIRGNCILTFNVLLFFLKVIQRLQHFNLILVFVFFIKKSNIYKIKTKSPSLTFLIKRNLMKNFNKHMLHLKDK